MQGYAHHTPQFHARFPKIHLTWMRENAFVILKSRCPFAKCWNNNMRFSRIITNPPFKHCGWIRNHALYPQIGRYCSQHDLKQWKIEDTDNALKDRTEQVIIWNKVSTFKFGQSNKYKIGLPFFGSLMCRDRLPQLKPSSNPPKLINNSSDCFIAQKWWNLIG